MKNAGNEPALKVECGGISNIRLDLNGMYCVIRTEQLTTTCINGKINVASEDIFHSVNAAMKNFNMWLFKLKNPIY